MTYRYQLIVEGKPWGEPLVSSDHVRSALNDYFAKYSEARPEQLLVGRLRQGEEGVVGRGVFGARAFLENAPNADPDEVFWHERVRDLLNSDLVNRHFFLWLHVERGSGDSTLNEAFLLEATSIWLSWLESLLYAPGAQPENVDNPEATQATTPDGGRYQWQGKEFEWYAQDLLIQLTAIPRRSDEPAKELVGNPEPAFAYYE